jgi:L-2-hydroxyglutarate oxidase LhgO
VADGFSVTLADDPETPVRCRLLINAAGLWAPSLAASIDGLDAGNVPTAHFAKGHYFAYRGRSPFSHLVYPVPVDGGLGIHATNDLAGAARFGPDVEWTDQIEYSFEDNRTAAFAEAIRRYFPSLDAEKLAPSYTGIRPKLSAQGQPPADFAIRGPATHGVPGLVNLFGIESPGLTASLAIADHVFELLEFQAR